MTVWILTSTVQNYYDDVNENFEGIWFRKPSVRELFSICGIDVDNAIELKNKRRTNYCTKDGENIGFELKEYDESKEYYLNK